jgi:erythromycin esterase-like protein
MPSRAKGVGTAARPAGCFEVMPMAHAPDADDPRETLPRRLSAAMEPLPDIDDPAFAAAFDRWADRRVVLLGEASHGTEEFYRARAAVTRRLVERHGFTILAIEADWPDAAALDRYVRDRPAAPDAPPPFRRFPTWMWRNTVVAELVEWLREWNLGRPMEDRAGVYGLDIYNLRDSMAAVLDYLEAADPAAAAVARERYGCLTPWRNDPAVYGRAVLTDAWRRCEEEALAQCREMLERSLEASLADSPALFDAAQNARLVAAAERYYRIMYFGGAESWNLRDTHMFETLERLLDAGGPAAKAVVWAHNSHIGDARATEMGQQRGELNLGQLARQRFGEAAALIGFGTHEGTVAAASDWGGEMEVKTINPGLRASVERLFHRSGVPRGLLDLGHGLEGGLRRDLAATRLERFIGVIYRPESERLSHYADVRLPDQFDGFVWFQRTRALTPLDRAPPEGGRVPDTWPFGL